MKAILFLLLAAAAASAQIGYPGQNPRYPGSSGPRLPIPGRGKQTSKQPDKVLPNFAGTLKLLDTKQVVVELDDARVLEFRRTDKTKFLNKGTEAKAADFKTGDHVSVEATEDPGGYMTAVNVYLEAPHDTTTAASPNADPDRPVLRRAGEDPKPAAAPKPETAKEAAKEPAEAPTLAAPAERATEVTKPVETRRDADDPGPPVLKRGKPEERPTTASEPPSQPEPPVEQAAAAPPPAIPGVIREVERLDEPSRGRAEDPHIRKAQEAALEFTETLPSYICQEMITRAQSDTQPVNWRPIDVVTMNLVYENGKESYKDITVGSKKVKSLDESGGAWSTGEFGTMLLDLFSPATNANFRFRKTSRAAGVDTRVYEFSVPRERSHWNIKAGSQGYMPAYTGSVWIDPRTGRVMRIEMQTQNLPSEFPLDKVESAVDYENIRLATVNTFLLPVHAETLACQRNSPVCSHNTIDFRNYRKYSSESTVTFEKQEK